MAQQYDGSNDTSRPRPQSYQAPPPTSDNTQSHHRSRHSSHLSSDTGMPQSQQPINDAVTSAVSSAEGSGKLDPDLIAQITEQVMNNLKLSGVTGHSGPPSQANSNISTNPPPRNIITPPSPDRPDDPVSDSASPPSYDSRQMDGYVDEQGYRQRSPQRPTSPPGDSRPSPPVRALTDDRTTLEKIWQPLFATDGAPTARLGQFLQGLAIHIIEDFEPRRSIVIPPQKMLKFYEAVKVSDEIYPWNSIFGGKMTNSSLSHLYRDLKCQHHYIQSRQDDKPNVPALTPLGFETWMTHIIRAHPDTEYNRFAKAVLNMPISNAENVKERFPKELSRRLFPKQANAEIQVDLEDAMLADPVIELTPYGLAQQRSTSSGKQNETCPPVPRNATGQAPGTGPAPNQTSGSTQVPPTPTTTTTSMPPPPPPPVLVPPAPMDKERQQNSSNSSDGVIDDSQPATSIERERKPYYAQPGGGKVYQDDELRPTKSDFQPHPRSYTTASSTRPIIDPPDDYGVSPRYRTGSLAAGNAQRSRYRSPSANGQQNPYSRSETDMPVGSYGSNASNLYPEYDDEGLFKTYSRGERSRRYRNEEHPRDYVPPPPPPHPPQGGPPPRSEYDEDIYRRGPAAGAYNQHYPPPPPRY